MDGMIVGVAVIVFSILAAPKLGWDASKARLKLLAAAGCFALGALLPLIAVEARDNGWLIAGGVAGAAGMIVVVLAVLDFRRA